MIPPCIHYSFHNSPPFVPILRDMNSVRPPTPTTTAPYLTILKISSMLSFHRRMRLPSVFFFPQDSPTTTQ